MASHLLVRAHIQDHNEANTTLKHYWGYPSRVLPCTKDAGTCQYLDAVYAGHNTTMLYTFILWGVLLGLGIFWVTMRGWRMGGPAQRMDSFIDQCLDSMGRAKRRWLSSDAPGRRYFGRVSRLQVLILAVMCGYLLIFSLIGIWYQTRITPIKGSTKHNTRTGLGPFADRLGALAYALTPFTILLSNRESVLSLVTGIPYQHFNFLHRWLGRIIFAQSLLHTIGWTIVEAKLYQPQPSVYVGFMSSQYIIFGVVAMFLITLMLVLSTETAIRWFGYEFFKVTHWIIAVLYIGACWGHWDKLWCWMVPSLALMLIDQVARGCRTLYLHLGGRKGESAGFKCAEARIQILGPPDDQVIRLDFTHSHHAPWQPGQHFHLCFPSLSIWQSHPFTPSSLPNPSSKLQHHTYLVRVRKGQTAQLAALGHGATVPVILTGPYGAALPSYGAQNVLAVAGGTGVTFTLPIVLETLRQQVGKRFAIDFVWAVRRARDLAWLEKEVDELKAAVNEHANLRVKIFVTRERVLSAVVNNTDEKAVTSTLKEMESASSGTSSMSSEKSTQSRFSIASLGDHHPSVQEHLADFMERASICGGAVEIVGSGPEAMGSDLRAAAAAVDTREMFDCYWDSRD